MTGKYVTPAPTTPISHPSHHDVSEMILRSRRTTYYCSFPAGPSALYTSKSSYLWHSRRCITRFSSLLLSGHGTDPSPQVTPTVCLASLPFLSSPCFMRLLAKFIGISIIAASCINKGKDRLSLSLLFIRLLS